MSPALWQLTLARFREFIREPAALFWVYGFPLILAFTLGLAFREHPVPSSQVDVQRRSREPRYRGETPRSARERSKSEGGRQRRFDVPPALADLEDRSHHRAATGHDGRPRVPVRRDSVRERAARNAADRVLVRASNPNTPVAPETAVAEPGGRYIDFLIPGLLGINLLGGGLFGVGFVTADMRVRKLLKRFQATPMRRSDFLLSLILSRLVFTLIDIGLLLAVAYWAFDIRVRGDFLAFLVLIVAGGACFAGVGLLVGSRARTIETAAGLMNAVMLPMYVLSGVFFSASRFPDWMQPFIQLLPLTVVNDGLRAIMNDGAGFESLGYPLLVVCLWSVVCFALALRIFRWR